MIRASLLIIAISTSILLLAIAWGYVVASLPVGVSL